MTRRERLLATLHGRPVDRPPVCLYELNGLDENPDDPDPFNVYNDPTWRPLLDLTRDRTDRIVMRHVPLRDGSVDPAREATTIETTEEDGVRITVRTVKTPSRVLRSAHRRERDTYTVWTTEPLLKDLDDLHAWLDLYRPRADGVPDAQSVLDVENALGDTGIVMLDTADPICVVADWFDLGTFTVLAYTEPALIHRALERVADWLLPRTEAVARALPGRLWRIFGPEYAAPPLLPPSVFRDYVVRYDTPMVAAIRRHDGIARIHSHGRLRDILPDIASMNADGLDPIEPPPQGDVDLAWVRESFGDRLVLFGNLEISEITGMPPDAFARRVAEAVRDGTRGPGRGFVLMPSACPYGRAITPRTLRNYTTMVEAAERVGASTP